MKEITYKQVMDTDGFLTALELWQDNQHITISLAQPTGHRSGYKWHEVKELIDRLATKALKDVQERTAVFQPLNESNGDEDG